MITDYLIELLEELRLPQRRRRRIVAEVEDHLTSAAAELHASGLAVDEAEREAVRRFGSATEIARSFIDLEVARSGSRLARVSGALALLFAAVVLGPPRLVPGNGAFPAGVMAFVLGQVALVAGGLTLLRWWRAAPEGGPRGPRLSLILRGASVVVACTAATVLWDALARRNSTAAAGLALAGFGLATAMTALILRRSWRLAASAGATSSACSPDEDALADIQAVALRAINATARRVPPLRAPLDRAVALALELPGEARRRAPRLSSWLDLRGHPWRFALTVATLAGMAMAAGHGAAEGVGARHLAGDVMSGALIMSIEALSALAGFALLGRFLGIRASR